MADNIVIRVAQSTDHDRILDFLRIHYYREEPLTVGSEPSQQDAADEEFNMSNIKHGTCLMAVMKNENMSEEAGEVIVGAVLAGPKDSNEAQHMFDEAALLGTTKWGNILHFLGGVERDANVFERYNVQKALHAHVLGVDSAIRGRALGARLMRELMALGRRCDYPLLTADCTSVYSARLCERLGMELVNTAPYADYLNAEGRVVFQPPAPHDCVKTFAVRL